MWQPATDLLTSTANVGYAELQISKKTTKKKKKDAEKEKKIKQRHDSVLTVFTCKFWIRQVLWSKRYLGPALLEWFPDY